MPCTPRLRTSWWSRRAGSTGRRLSSRRTASLAAGLLPAGVVVHAVDANGQWARPGPRLVEGVEELAALLHP